VTVANELHHRRVPAAPERSWLRRLLSGPQTDARWVRPSLLLLLTGTAVAYLAGLSQSGNANAFYAAAVQAGSRSWKAFLFGSFDSANFITVDKPPASLWVMELSARVFGFGSWSLLVPQALEGVACVGVVYATVRRRFSAGAALSAGLVLATTPVAALMFRVDNPDALLVLLLIVATYAVLRGLEAPASRSATRWLITAGAAIGFGFLTKTLQAFLVVPALTAVVLLCAAASWRRRCWLLGCAAGSLAVSAGWWLAVVGLWPAGSRPYIGGSQDNSEWNLIFGYNGFGRLTGNETGSVGGGPGGMWGATGITRLLGSDMGSQIAWLLPSALLLAGVALWLYRRSPRGDLARAQVVAWSGWLVVTGLTFSFAKGIIHPYYTVALAPPIAALVGIGASELWRRRSSAGARAAAVMVLAVTVAMAWDLLDRSPGWLPWLRPAVLAAGLVAAAAVARSGAGSGCWPGLTGLAVPLALAAAVAGPAAATAATSGTPHTGAIPSAGPAQTSLDLLSGKGNPGPGGIGGPGVRGGGRGPGPGGFGAGGRQGSTPGAAPGGQIPGPGIGAPGGGTRTGPPTLGSSRPAAAGAAGGLLDAGSVGPALSRLLRSGGSAYRWAAAAVSAESAAGFQLATGDPVMAIGGFNGTDPAPSLAQFEGDVDRGEVHYFVASGGGAVGGVGIGGGIGGGGQGRQATSDASRISAWVEAHFTARTVDGVTVYDLTAPVKGVTDRS
jgi:4-amino-4-deoxy-L-arabinose transferase-like glycosyltransferase